MKFAKLNHERVHNTTYWIAEDGSCVIMLESEYRSRNEILNNKLDTSIRISVSIRIGIPEGILCEPDGVESFIINELMHLAIAAKVEDTSHELCGRIEWFFHHLKPIANIQRFSTYKERKRRVK